MKRFFIYLFIIVGLILTFMAGFYFSFSFITPNTLSCDNNRPQMRLSDKKYEFIRPLLSCETYENMEYTEYKDLRDRITKSINQAKNDSKITTASIYFRDLSTGKWAGIDENDTYAPASLLKVPIMIGYLKQSEQDPNLLQKKFFYHDTNPLNVKPLIDDPLLKNNQTYTAKELIDAMIIDSDNHAMELLRAEINPNILTETYSDLGVASPLNKNNQTNNEYRIATKTYALFLRVLYNGTYLKKENSEKALKILSESKFTKGLRAGVPTEIKIAHKYGIRQVADEGTQHIELNDCGIIYGRTNYILCIMTSGQNPEAMSSLIAEISATTYHLVEDGQNK